ncbi:MAG: hypothetical protein R3E65_01035 [Steroidobacteraceae bacterium]
MLLAFKNPCVDLVAERQSFIGGVYVPPQDPQPIHGPGDPSWVDNPYNLGTCDYWASPIEHAMLVFGLAVVLIISGAAAARIGEKRSVLRGIAANAILGAFAVIALSRLGSPEPKIDDVVLYGTLVVLVAASLGAVGGVLVRRVA